MFWAVMFEAASNVGPERAPKKMPILFLEPPDSTHSKHSRQQAQQTAERKPQQHELDVHAAVVCSCKSTYVFFQYFFVMYIHPKKSCTSKGATEKKSRAYRIEKKKMHTEGSSTSPAPACSIWPVMSVK